MTNPDNIVRVRARNGGRASVYEANGWAQAYTSGLLEGTGVIQNTSADMNVLVGGSVSKPDVVLAENPAGYKIALDIVGQKAVTITAPASNSRISAIVAYTDDLSLATTEDTVTGSPASCGLIVVNGTASVSPSAPTDNQIRTAITADGATGSQAAYCVIATVLVANDTTIITNSLITNKTVALTGNNMVSSATIVDGSITEDKIDYSTLTKYSDFETSVAITTTYQDFFTYQIPVSGDYLVIISCNFHTASSLHTPYIDIKNNGTSIDTAYSGIAANTWGNMSVQNIYTFTAGDTITVAMRDSVGLTASSNTKLRFVVVRV